MRALPEEWVGSQSRIKPLVRLLCAQMALAFDATQTACPPWRQQKSVISKWLPAKVGALVSGLRVWDAGSRVDGAARLSSAGGSMQRCAHTLTLRAERFVFKAQSRVCALVL